MATSTKQRKRKVNSMNGNVDKSLLFMFLSFVCIWLVVDVAVGKNYLGNFLNTLFPFMSSDLAAQTLEAQGNITSSGLVDLNDPNRHTAAKDSITREGGVLDTVTDTVKAKAGYGGQ